MIGVQYNKKGISRLMRCLSDFDITDICHLLTHQPCNLLSNKQRYLNDLNSDSCFVAHLKYANLIVSTKCVEMR